MREKPRNPVSVTKTISPIPDGRLFGVGAATGGDRVSAEGKDGRTPAMRHLFAKRAHCKWHNIAPPERRRIGSTCARVPKVSSRNRGCPFRGYGCGGNPQEGGTTLPCQRNNHNHPAERRYFDEEHGRAATLGRAVYLSVHKRSGARLGRSYSQNSAVQQKA